MDTNILSLFSLLFSAGPLETTVTDAACKAHRHDVVPSVVALCAGGPIPRSLSAPNVDHMLNDHLLHGSAYTHSFHRQ